MKLLAIDTATECCSVALWQDGVITASSEVAPQQHGKLLLPMVQALLQPASIEVSNLDGIVFGRGPGSFTGVRIAASAAQALALAASVPVAGVSTLAALAAGAARNLNLDRCVAMIDARMGEVYCAAYQCLPDNTLQTVADEQVIAPDQLSSPDTVNVWPAVGSGADAYSDTLRANGFSIESESATRFPQAEDMLRLVGARFGELGVPAEQALPVYLRNKVALTTAERKNG